MPMIEFSPRSPFHDIEGFVRKVRAAHPGVTDHGINQAVKRALDGYKPRHKGRIVSLYGADIMTDTLTDIPAWPYLSSGEQGRIQEFPVTGGALVSPDDPRLAQVALANRLDRHNVNRSVLISPRGLSRTYVWCHANDWLQEMTASDWGMVSAIAGNARLFRDRDVHGPYVPVRSYDAPARVVEISRTVDDVAYAFTQLERAPQWRGADLEA